jgi:hypothetical protein
MRLNPPALAGCRSSNVLSGAKLPGGTRDEVFRNGDGWKRVPVDNVRSFRPGQALFSPSTVPPPRSLGLATPYPCA